MNTLPTPKPKLRIDATFVGPIMGLTAVLSGEKQNLVFATNGTGKSFLSRAFRVLDQNPKDLIPDDIVSEEGDVGTFAISEDNAELGRLELNTKGESMVSVDGNTIFHVFSSDYVEVELKRSNYELDGEITHEIILGKPNVELSEKQESLKEKQDQYLADATALMVFFKDGKETLKTNFGITASLSDYKALTKENLLSPIKAEPVELSVEAIKVQYEKLKSLPNGAEIDDQPSISDCLFDPTQAQAVLQKVVSPSVIEEQVKNKIAKTPDFFWVGLRAFEQDSAHCHFCTQELSGVAVSAIHLYQQYFADEEAKTQVEIASVSSVLLGLKRQIEKKKLALQQVDAKFNELKVFFPNHIKETLDTTQDQLDALLDEYENICDLLEEKSSNITKVQSVEWVPRLLVVQSAATGVIEANNKKIKSLRAKLAKVDDQRREFQRAACKAFDQEFRTQHKTALEAMDTLKAEGSALATEVEQLKQVSGDKVQARERVAQTFEELLGYMFGNKYTFDRERFVVQRNQTDMTRGGDRTLSDGEKSILGFCYYLAQTHLKVTRAEDYGKVFFVIDDPVSSVSFDYIYGISQVIKSLRIKDAELLFDSSSNPKPRILILTHNDYFYNLAGSNGIIKKDALFQLVDKKGRHELNNQRDFVSPHVSHMKEVIAVADAATPPDFQTANSIRCVLEGMWRFYKPDLKDLGAFVTFLSKDLGIEIKSMLILHNLSHGAKTYSDANFETDLLLASKEIVEVVKLIAPGQLNS